MKYTLPEKWFCIVTRENQKMLDTWRKAHARSHEDHSLSPGYTVVSQHPRDESHYWGSDIRGSEESIGFTELTTEEFERLVWNRTEISSDLSSNLLLLL